MRFRFFDRLIFFVLSGETAATIQGNTLHAKRRWLQNSLEERLYRCRNDVITNHRKITIHRWR